MAETRASPHKKRGERGKRRRATHLGPERRRPQVLDAALELFLKRGYEGTSMQAVADQAGVTKPVVYACYSSKDALFRALLEREENRIL
jgi:AcrR family transcriptional regulator